MRVSGVAPRPVSPTRLIIAGVAIEALLVVFVLIYVNVPPGFNVPYGLHPPSVALFRTLWNYPQFQASADTLSLAAMLTVLALWGVYVVTAFGLLRRPSVESRSRSLSIILGFAALYNLELALI